ncbi:MAG: peptidase U32 family protein, partial [Bacillota bacterium]
MNILIHADEPLLRELVQTKVDGVVIGVRPFAQRMRETYTPSALKPLVETARSHGKSVFLNMNAIIHEGDLEALDYVFHEIKDFPVSGILFADLAVIETALKYGLKHLLIYDAETYLTNHQDTFFWEDEEVQGTVGARQLTAKDILSIAEKSPLPFGIQGHGHVNMFHSARPLVENYFKHMDAKEPDQYNRTRLEMVEAKREDEPYPMYQDDFGTHVFRSKPMHSFHELKAFKEVLSYFVVDTLFYEESRVLTIARDLVKARDEGVDASILKRYEDHDEGFLNKKTV